MVNFQELIEQYKQEKLEVGLNTVYLDTKLYNEYNVSHKAGENPESNIVFEFHAGYFYAPKLFGYGHTIEEAVLNFQRQVGKGSCKYRPDWFLYEG
jgi:hypothetical protein